MDDESVAEALCAFERGDFEVAEGQILMPGWWFVGTDVAAVMAWLEELWEAQLHYKRAPAWRELEAARRWLRVAGAKWAR